MKKRNFICLLLIFSLFIFPKNIKALENYILDYSHNSISYPLTSNKDAFQEIISTLDEKVATIPEIKSYLITASVTSVSTYYNYDIIFFYSDNLSVYLNDQNDYSFTSRSILISDKNLFSTSTSYISKFSNFFSSYKDKPGFTKSLDFIKSSIKTLNINPNSNYRTVSAFSGRLTTKYDNFTDYYDLGGNSNFTFPIYYSSDLIFDSNYYVNIKPPTKPLIITTDTTSQLIKNGDIFPFPISNDIVYNTTKQYDINTSFHSNFNLELIPDLKEKIKISLITENKQIINSFSLCLETSNMEGSKCLGIYEGSSIEYDFSNTNYIKAFAYINGDLPNYEPPQDVKILISSTIENKEFIFTTKVQYLPPGTPVPPPPPDTPEDLEWWEYLNPKNWGRFFHDMFVPKPSFFEKHFSLLEKNVLSKLGFLSYPFEFISNLFNKISNITTTTSLHIPNIKLPGIDVNVIPATTFNLLETFQKEGIVGYYNLLKLVTNGLLVFGFISLCFKKFNEFFKNRGS